MLLIDTTPATVVQIFITSFIGIFGVSAALEGYLGAHMNPVIRVIMAAGGILLIDPSLITDIVGILFIGAGTAWQYLIAAGRQGQTA